MESANMESDLYMGGVTLRALLENRDLFTLPPPAKRTEKDEKEGGDVYSDATAAFLGPNLWDKTLSDFKLEYIDLDDLLGSNGSGEDGHQKRTEGAHSAKAQAAQQLLHLNSSHETQSTHPQGGSSCNPTTLPLPQQHHHHQQQQQHPCNIASPSSPESSSDSQKDPEDGKTSPCFVECKFSPNDLALATVPGQENFDPTLTILHDDDLKPQPMIKKSRKHFVPEDLKDDKYWARRRKNNIAAKRSREARRIKENQIVLRASYLEKENNTLKDDVQRLKAENEMLRIQLKKYEH